MHFASIRTACRVPRAAGLILAVALLVSACASSGRGQTRDERPVVLTTFTVLADIAENVAGDRLQVGSITKPGAEIHGYEPTPSDVARAAEADLILDNGLNLEAWFEQFVIDADAPHVVVSDGVEAMDIAGGEYSGTPNPHAWMSPANVQIYVQNMAAAFAELDPEGAAQFEANAEAYSVELQAVQDELTGVVDELPHAHRALVTCEGAFSYLARDAGLDERYLWAVNAEQQGTAQQLAALIEFVRDRDVPAVFCESTVSDASMQQVVQATEAEFGGTLYVDSLSKDGGPVPTYLDLIRHDVETVIAGLSEQ